MALGSIQILATKNRRNIVMAWVKPLSADAFNIKRFLQKLHTHTHTHTRHYIYEPELKYTYTWTLQRTALYGRIDENHPAIKWVRGVRKGAHARAASADDDSPSRRRRFSSTFSRAAATAPRLRHAIFPFLGGRFIRNRMIILLLQYRYAPSSGRGRPSAARADRARMPLRGVVTSPTGRYQSGTGGKVTAPHPVAGRLVVCARG